MATFSTKMQRLTADHSRRCESKHAAVFSLPIVQSERLGGHATHIKHSRASWRRFAVLLTVQLIIAGHIAVWLLLTMRNGVSATLSPVEPSESMYTLETGALNAGFIFFATAILSTLIFGRFFCGWGCHVVALQDLCAWAMTKVRVKPRPFRSRLLLYVPLVMALYMFVWPTFKRLVLRPIAGLWGGGAWPRLSVWLGDAPVWPGWSSGLMVEDFWHTFPPWYVAIPFLLVCGFGAVYFLGSKGFCTYACPYAGFFAPADLLAPGKIRVTDDCEQCGHCTAVCTSNVRVHEEVRDFGMVVDPGCMKCMDCISVCPNDALYFGMGKPTILAKPRDEAAKARRALMKGNFDLTRPEEILVAILFTALFLSFRAMLNQVPMLMALAMAGIGSFCAWKLITLVREEHSRLQSLQLKYRGRLKPAGYIFVPLALLYLAAGVWSGVVRYNLWRGDIAYERVSIPREQAFAPNFQADDATRRDAQDAIDHYLLAGPPGPEGGGGGGGGIGWTHRPEITVHLAYLSMVLARYADAEFYLRAVLRTPNPADQLVFDLARILELQGHAPADAALILRDALAAHPAMTEVRRVLAAQAIETSRPDDALRLVDDALALFPNDPSTRFSAAMVAMAVGRTDRGLTLLDEAAAIALKRRGQATVLRQLAAAMFQADKRDRAVELMETAARRAPGFPGMLLDLADLYLAIGRNDDAIAVATRGAALTPDDPSLALHMADLCEHAGKPADSQKWRARAQELQAKRPRPAPSQEQPPVR